MIVYGVTSDGRRIRLEEEVVSVEICEGGGGDALQRLRAEKAEVEG